MSAMSASAMIGEMIDSATRAGQPQWPSVSIRPVSSRTAGSAKSAMSKQVVPLTTEQVAVAREALPPQLQALVTLAAGTGMRQAECLGLTVDRVKFLECTVTVDRQLVTVPGQPPSLGPPKTQASNRTIPLPQVVVDTLAAHLAAFPSRPTGCCSRCQASRSPGKPLATSGVRRLRKHGFRPGPGSTRYATTTRACLSGTESA